MPDFFTLNFMWLPMLSSLGVIPLILFLYSRKSRRTFAANQASNSRFRQHLPISLHLIGIFFICLAIARPQAVMLKPMREAMVMLAIDISGSMRATDVEPNRIDAAKVAASRFIEAKPGSMRVGIVTIAATAALAQAPTEQRDDLLQTLESLPLQYGSALGSGVLIALEALLPGANIDAQKIINEASEGPAKKTIEGQSLDAKSALPKKSDNAPNVPNGRAMAIVLLSDGQGNMGPDLLEMAKIAAQHRVRIFTVGVGTLAGAIVQVQGQSMRVRLEEEFLRRVANETEGEYFRATSSQALNQIYDQLGYRLRFEKRAVSEVSSFVLAIGMFFILLACFIAFKRYGRIV